MSTAHGLSLRFPRVVVIACALAMPLVAFVAQRRVFGPDNATLSDRYPTLLVAAGYGFSIWGLIFIWDLAFAAWQARARSPDPSVLGSVGQLASAGFALTALWMPVFSLQIFWAALIIIWAALACTAASAVALSRAPAPSTGQTWFAWAPLSLHAGWLALAAFLNTAQVVVAYRVFDTEQMLPWSLGLFAAAAAILLLLNQRMRGNLAFAAAASWGLVAVYVKQSRSEVPGAEAASYVALVVGLLVVGQTAWLLRRKRRLGAA